MPDITLENSIAFDDTKQSAFIGWCLRDAPFFVQASRVVKPEWFADPFDRKTYKAMLEIFYAYHRNPEATEIHLWRGLQNEDSATKAKVERSVSKGIEASMGYGIDLIRDDMEAWLAATIFRDMINKSTAKHNAKKVADAWDQVEEMVNKYRSSSFRDGIQQGFQPSDEVIDLEREDRVRNVKRALSYGVLFLDEALYGILPNELIVLGAATGSGKTQLAVSIALHNASKGKRVHYFALEAENYEMERRLKYGMIANRYYAQGGGKRIDYGAWRMGLLAEELDPIEEQLKPAFKQALKGLNVLYRKDGHFNLQNLHRQLLSLVGKTDLIILDHLHYVDTDGEEENSAYKEVIMALRDIVLRYEIPVIVVAHLRKKSSSRADSKIVPTVDDFHGTSNITKVATTAIMLGRAYDQDPSQPGSDHLWPTYMRIAKSRMDGSRTYHIAVAEFNSRTQCYEPNYRIGRGIDMDSAWEQAEKLLYWQKTALAQQIAQQGMVHGL